MWRPTIYPPDLNDRVVDVLTNALYWIDVDYLERHPEAPPLYESGVRYQREPRGQERWLAMPAVLERRAGDCEDLACWRASELTLAAARAGHFDLAGWLEAHQRLWQALPARPVHRFRDTPRGRLYHVLVGREGGELEDPSRVLGMR